MENLSGVDDFWLRQERPENLLTITAVVHFRTTVTEQMLKAKFGDDLLPFTRFRRKVNVPSQYFGQARWEDDPKFSLGRHVFTRHLPDGDPEALRKLISELMSEPLPRHKPLWDAHLIEGPRPGTTLMVRVHHCLADGFSLIRLMLALIDKDCEVELPGNAVLKGFAPDNEEADPGGRLEAAREFAEKLMDSGLRVLRNPVPDTGPVRDVALCATHLLAMPADSDTSLKGELGKRKLAAWSGRISLAQMKDAAKGFGGTLNDVLLAALAGAFRRYLKSRDEPIEGKDLRAVVPVNVRPWDTRTDDLGNGFGLVYIDLPAGLRSIEERMRVLKERMDALKQSPEAFVTYGLMAAVGMLPAVLQEQMLRLFEGKGTAIVTNVPGPTSPIRIAGGEIEDLYFFVPQSAGAGLGISIFSYNGGVRMGLATDAGLVPDPIALIGHFHAELAEMGVGLLAP